MDVPAQDTKPESNPTVVGQVKPSAPRFPYNHPRGGSLVWGLIAIFAGLILLLNNLNLIPWSVWRGIGRFWPLILIIIGIDTLIGQSWISRLFILILSSVFFATVIGLVLLRTSPDLLTGLSPQIMEFLKLVNSYVR